MNLQQLEEKATASELTLIEEVKRLCKEEAASAIAVATQSYIRNNPPDRIYWDRPELQPLEEWTKNLTAFLRKLVDTPTNPT